MAKTEHGRVGGDAVRSPIRRLAAAGAALFLLAVASAAFAGDPLRLMPESASAEADRIDDLTYLIFWVTGATFVGVQVVLVWFLWAYRRKPGVKAKHTHGNHTVEMIWTVAPAAILVFLAVYQMGLWKELKSTAAPDNAGAVKVQIFAKRFEWNFRYAGADGLYATDDDLITSGVLVVPVNRPVNAELRSMDVIHSFFLPNLRFKQDAVPGLTGNIWFRPNKLSTERDGVRDRNGVRQELKYFDVVCAEICGNAHTTMAAKLYVVSDADYEKFLRGEPTSLGGEIGPPMRADLKNPTGAYDKVWVQWAAQDDLVPPGPPKWKRNPFGEDDRGEAADEGDF